MFKVIHINTSIKVEFFHGFSYHFPMSRIHNLPGPVLRNSLQKAGTRCIELRRRRLCWLRRLRRICDDQLVVVPICSMYGIFTYIWVIFRVNVGKYSIHMEHLGYSYHQKMVIWGMIYHWVYYIIQLNMCGTHNNEPSAYYIPINNVCIYIYMYT